jgi:large conductance mechanosensitive channel
VRVAHALERRVREDTAMLQEFKEFINRGNVVELAVAFVMGVAFKPIIDNLVSRVLMPVIGMLVGQPNFDTVGTFACEPGLDPSTNIVAGDTVCAGSIGAVLTATINFVLIALALFFVVKAYNRMNRKVEEVPEPEADPEDVVLLREIRDALRTPR